MAISLRLPAPWRVAAALTAAALTAVAVPTALATASASTRAHRGDDVTTTPIKHVVIAFQENIPFDKYFGTYPNAENLPGEPPFHAKPGTPTVNGLTDVLLHSNPNAANPHRFSRDEPNICGSNHGYLAEQKAYDHGLVDRFVEETGNHGPGCDGTHGLGYFDGNTVTALWNYAQNFAMSDNSYGTTYGPSHIGVLNLVSGQTHGAVPTTPTSDIVDGTMVGNVQPTYDDCPISDLTAHMTGRNIGDLLNAKNVTWGWFSDGFRPTSRLPDGTAVCDKAKTNIHGFTDTVYDAGNEGFQYYASTANQHHLPPTSVAMIGHQDQANHQYDLSDFWAAARHGNLPAVSFLKAGGYQQGGGDDSDPIDEQHYLVSLINGLERLPQWRSTAVIWMYDDSDGGYDHVMPPVINQSQTIDDALTGPGQCGTHAPLLSGYQGRCGFGPRLPLLIMSPYARPNFVDHTITSQTSVIRFIEDNWRLGRIGDGSFDAVSGSLDGMFDFSRPSSPRLFLNPDTGEPVGQNGQH
jgi:phospholipase C